MEAAAALLIRLRDIHERDLADFADSYWAYGRWSFWYPATCFHHRHAAAIVNKSNWKLIVESKSGERVGSVFWVKTTFFLLLSCCLQWNLFHLSPNKKNLVCVWLKRFNLESQEKFSSLHLIFFSSTKDSLIAFYIKLEDHLGKHDCVCRIFFIHAKELCSPCSNDVCHTIVSFEWDTE